MRFSIDAAILERYPQTEVGWLVADVFPVSADPVVDRWKAALAGEMASNGLTLENLSSCPEVVRWRQVFGSMGVKPSKYRCSLEALLRRVLKENALWTVNSVVDLYNCVSVKTLLPMGAFDLDKIRGNLFLRFGRQDETFEPLGQGETEEVLPQHVVYADDEKVCCWLWNHRDSRLVGLDEGTRRAVFLIDHAFSPTTTSTEAGLEILWEKLAETGSNPVEKGICSVSQPEQEIS
ncbi:MAG: B3/4 domain-containing protein [Synergistales bacterium]